MRKVSLALCVGICVLVSSACGQTQPEPKAAEAGKLLVKAKSKPDHKWKEYETRTLDQLADFKQDKDVPLTKYGGRADKKAEAKGFFYPKQIDGRWWLIDPDGGLFIHTAVVAIGPGNSNNMKAALAEKFKTSQGWSEATTRMLHENGFNGTGAWSTDEVNRASSQRLAYTPIWNFMSSFGSSKKLTIQQPGHAGYPNDCILAFHPEFETWCDKKAQALAAVKDDPYLLGHFSDNELPAPRIEKFLALDANNPDLAYGYRAARDWMDKKKGKHATAKDLTEQERDEFMGFVWDKYFEVTTKAIRKYDPHHMCIGSRFHSVEKKSPASFQAAGKHLDVISINYYGAWTPDLALIANWNKWSGRPVIITEWYTKGADTPLKNSTGAGWIVPTQKDRGLFYQNYTLALLESRGCVGWHWFKYMDNDPEDLRTDPSNRDSNKGIVNIKYEPYAPLMDLMKPININVYRLADYFDAKK